MKVYEIYALEFISLIPLVSTQLSSTTWSCLLGISVYYLINYKITKLMSNTYVHLFLHWIIKFN